MNGRAQIMSERTAARVAGGRLVAAVGLASLLVAAAACRDRVSSPAASAPNIIVVSLDTLRADRLGSYGYARPTSPSLDRLAAGGVRFSAAVAESSWTLPSHMTLMTGLRPSAHGVTIPQRKLAEEIPLLAQTLRAHGYRTFAITAGGYVRGNFGFDRGFEEYLDEKRGLASTLELARRRIQSLEAGTPYFLFLHTYDLHCPYTPPASYREMFSAIPAREQAQIYAAVNCLDEKLDLEMQRFVSDQYDAGIRAADDLLGKFLAWLDERGERHDTVLVFLSDHGEEFGEHGELGHGKSLYAQALQIPLIVVAPGFAPRVVDEPVGLADVAPTLLELAGVSAPRMEGRSLVTLMRGDRENDAARTVFSELDDRSVQRSIVRGDLHLILDEQNQTHLFDLENDPRERRALAMNEEGRALQRALETYISQANPVAPPEGAPIPPAVAERLRALGYDPDSAEAPGGASGTMPLLAAARAGDVAAVEKLLAEGADINGRDALGLTALIGAAALGREPVVRLLIERGAAVDGTDRAGATALLRAGEAGHVGVAEALLAAGASFGGTGGTTPLDAAAAAGQVEMVAMLLRRGADPNKADDAGRTALHSSAAAGQLEVLKILLEKGARQIPDAAGVTPFLAAAMAGQSAVLGALVAAGADPNGRDGSGSNALHLVARAGVSREVAATLIDLGTDIDAARPDGWTALMLAAAQREGGEVAKLLVERGANVDARGDEGQGALFLAAADSRLDLVRLLLAKGAAVDSASGDGTPLVAAVSDGGVETARLLLESGADPDATDEAGNTALLIAANDDEAKIVALLLEHGADIERANEDGETAFTLADEGEIRAMLRKAREGGTAAARD